MSLMKFQTLCNVVRNILTSLVENNDWSDKWKVAVGLTCLDRRILLHSGWAPTAVLGIETMHPTHLEENKRANSGGWLGRAEHDAVFAELKN